MRNNQLPMNTDQHNFSLKILLAEDSHYDRYFFSKVLKEIPIPTHITTVNDGTQLMDYLAENSEHLPDFLFLDLNMPGKNGFECLSEIKQDKKLCDFPVVIFTTSFRSDKDYEQSLMNMLLKIGAHDFISKTYDLEQLKELIHHSLTMTIENHSLN
jgi:CheY-like chemotaxis protein